MVGGRGVTSQKPQPFSLNQAREGRDDPDDRAPEDAEEGALPSAESPDPRAQADVGLAHGLAASEQGPDGADPPDDRGPHGDADEAVAQRQHPVEHR